MTTNMAVPANFACQDREKFQHCFSKLAQFKYSDDGVAKTDLNLLLDQLNSLEYSTVVVSVQVITTVHGHFAEHAEAVTHD